MSANAISSRCLNMARAAWGEPLPAWVEHLANECDAASQSAVAQRMSYSGAAVGEVLRRRWSGSYTNVEQAFRGAYQAAQVRCPVLGALPAHRCLEHQRSPYASTNPIRIRLYRACRAACPNARIHSAPRSTGPAGKEPA